MTRVPSLAWLVSAWTGLAIAGGCSSADAPPDGGLLDAGAADSGVQPTTSDAAAEGTASDAATCDDCGSARFTAECTSAEMACLNDLGCADIRNCVFSGGDASTPCALDATGPICVESCIRATCADSRSATLYRALDQCVYCTDCTSSCLAYCSAFSDAGSDACH